MRTHAAPLLLVLATGLLSGAARADGPGGALPRAGIPPVTPPAAPPMRTLWAPPPLQVADLPSLPMLPGAGYGPPGLARKPLPVPERHSTGAMVMGIVTVSTGVLSLGIGTVLGLASQRRCNGEGDVPEPFPGGPRNDPTSIDGCGAGSGGAAGMGFLVGSALLAGIGIPLWVFGAQRSSRYPDVALGPLSAPRLLVGPGTAGLRFAF